MTAVFLWWNEVKQNIPTIKVFSQKKISIIRLFRGRSLFLKGHIKRGSSPEKPTQTSCTINYKRATKNSLQKIHPSWHPLFGSASLGDPVSLTLPPVSPKDISISLWERIPYQERVAVSAYMILGWTMYMQLCWKLWHPNIPGLVGGFPNFRGENDTYLFKPSPWFRSH